MLNALLQETKARKITLHDAVNAAKTAGRTWECGFEFDYTSEEAFVCRPLRLPGYEDKPVHQSKFSTVPDVLEKPENRVRICFLPPMSGLAAVEPKVEHGRIDVLLGEGQTAQVLRNLCHAVCEANPEAWKAICGEMESLFRLWFPYCDPTRSLQKSVRSWMRSSPLRQEPSRARREFNVERGLIQL